MPSVRSTTLWSKIEVASLSRPPHSSGLRPVGGCGQSGPKLSVFSTFPPFSNSIDHFLSSVRRVTPSKILGKNKACRSFGKTILITGGMARICTKWSHWATAVVNRRSVTPPFTFRLILSAVTWDTFCLPAIEARSASEVRSCMASLALRASSTLDRGQPIRFIRRRMRREDFRGRMPHPEGMPAISPGSRSAPGVSVTDESMTPEGSQRRLATTCSDPYACEPARTGEALRPLRGRRARHATHSPGAPRPGANGWDPSGVTRSPSAHSCGG